MKTILNTPGIGLSSIYIYENHNVSYTPETTNIFQNGKCLVQSMVDILNKKERKLELWLEQGGSAEDGTKTGIPDEMDMRLHIGSLEVDSVLASQDSGFSIILKVADSISGAWEEFIDDAGVLSPTKLYPYIEGICCQALANKSILINTNFYFLYKKEQAIFLEVSEGPYLGMIFKIDLTYVVRINYDRVLKAPKDCSKMCNTLLRPTAWMLSCCLQEGYTMSRMNLVPRLSYMLAKIINGLVNYKDEKVRSYDIKHALLYELGSYLHGGTEYACKVEQNEDDSRKVVPLSGVYTTDDEPLQHNEDDSRKVAPLSGVVTIDDEPVQHNEDDSRKVALLSDVYTIDDEPVQHNEDDSRKVALLSGVYTIDDEPVQHNEDDSRKVALLSGVITIDDEPVQHNEDDSRKVVPLSGVDTIDDEPSEMDRLTGKESDTEPAEVQEGYNTSLATDDDHPDKGWDTTTTYLQFSEETLQQVTDFTWNICKTHLKHILVAGDLYYYGIGKCRPRKDAYKQYMKYVCYILNKQDLYYSDEVLWEEVILAELKKGGLIT